MKATALLELVFLYMVTAKQLHNCFLKTSKIKKLPLVCHSSQFLDCSNLEDGGDAENLLEYTKVKSNNYHFNGIDISTFLPNISRNIVYTINKLDSSASCMKLEIENSYSLNNVTLHIRGLELPNGGYVLRGENFATKFSHENAKPCLKAECVSPEYNFSTQTGLLQFYFKFDKNEKCYAEYDNQITLFKIVYKNPMSKELCESFNNSMDYIISKFSSKYRTSIEKVTSTGKYALNFYNVETGCYFVRAKIGCSFGLYWLKSSSVFDTEAWNTTVLIVPRENEKKIQIQWEWPSYPYNFTGWDLALWYIKDKEVNCNIDNGVDIVIIRPNGTIYANNYTFTNLSSGYYCLRLQGVDPRCDDGYCSIRSSKTVNFNTSRITMETDTSGPNNIIAIVLLPIAGLIIAVCFAILCFQWLHSNKKTKTLYERVSDNKQKLLIPVKVVLIWTKYHSPNSPDPEPLVKALKKLLKNYCVVQLYDYMDPLSMPKDQCSMLYSDPTAWLSQKLRQVDYKIIIVASEGAAYRKSLSETDHNFNERQELLSQMDDKLFPHALRYLKEFRNLALDYSRVYQVCFPDVYGADVEFDDLVPSARFNMPHHLNELARRLHGFREDSVIFFNSQTEDDVHCFTEAIKLMEK